MFDLDHGWSNSTAFGIIGGPSRSSVSRPVSVRLLIVQACKQLTAANKGHDGFHELGTVLRQIDQIRPSSETPVQVNEMLEICETEGDSHNGGGYFTIKTEGPGRTLVRHEADGSMISSTRGSIAPGEIGSPIPGASIPSSTSSAVVAPTAFAGGPLQLQHQHPHSNPHPLHRQHHPLQPNSGIASTTGF